MLVGYVAWEFAGFGAVVVADQGLNHLPITKLGSPKFSLLTSLRYWLRFSTDRLRFSTGADVRLFVPIGSVRSSVSELSESVSAMYELIQNGSFRCHPLCAHRYGSCLAVAVGRPGVHRNTQRTVLPQISVANSIPFRCFLRLMHAKRYGRWPLAG